MKYRSRIEIASDILNAVVDGNATKSRLMNSSFLTFSQLNKYLNFLLENTLIARDGESGTYALTEKGVRFLHAYEDLMKLTELIVVDAPIPAA
jgi:predicted transcriptional regulator